MRFERGQEGSGTVDKVKGGLPPVRWTGEGGPHVSRGRRVPPARPPNVGGSASDPGAAPDNRGPSAASAALAVSVSETPDAVLVHIRASGDVEPGSVEVRFAGHKTVVLARDAEGRAIRSQPLRLPEPVTEEGSSADYDADGALVMTLRKQATAHGAGLTDDPEAAAR